MLYRSPVFRLLVLAFLVSGVSLLGSSGIASNLSKDPQLLAQGNVNKDELFEGTLQGCKRTGTSVQCSVAVRSKKDTEYRVLCQQQNLTRLFDTSGNVYTCSKIKLGNLEAENSIDNVRFPQGTPVKVTITFNDVSANEFDTLELHFLNCCPAYYYQFLKFKNIVIQTTR
jgi:hypothetical protein